MERYVADHNTARGRDYGVTRSYQEGRHIVDKYCTELTIKFLHPLQAAVQEKTFKDVELSEMLGSPENYLRLIGGKRVLDIGTYTGASAVAWALAIPDNGEVLSMDVSHKYLNKTRALIEAEKDVAKKITFHLGPAFDQMNDLLSAGEAGKWDFVFIDADKDNYTNYYERAVELLRPGGVILIDNALWAGEVAEPVSSTAKSIDSANRRVFADPRTASHLLNVGDGLHVAFKL